MTRYGMLREYLEESERIGNSLPRKKAQYIVEAVRHYRHMQRENGDSEMDGGNATNGERIFKNGAGHFEPERTGLPLDKEQIRQIVLQVLAEWAENKENVTMESEQKPAASDAGKTLEMEDLNVILGALEAMRS